MRTNADLTIYNKYVDPVTRSEKYQRAQVVGVAWENRKAANVLRTGGQIAADQAVIYVPFSSGANYNPPRKWQADRKGWTLQEGDVVVKGLVSKAITDAYTATDLKNEYDNVLIITSVDTMDYGSASMHHWQVGAK